MHPIIPQPNITAIGLGFHFLSTNSDNKNRITDTGFNVPISIENPLSPQKAKIKIDSPADAISATTAGLNPSSTP